MHTKVLDKPQRRRAHTPYAGQTHRISCAKRHGATGETASTRVATHVDGHTISMESEIRIDDAETRATIEYVMRERQISQEEALDALIAIGYYVLRGIATIEEHANDDT